MGCCYARDVANITAIENLLLKAEMELNLNNFSAQEIDRTFYRYSTDRRITKHQFYHACRKLGLNLKSKVVKEFFLQFLDRNEQVFYVQQLSTLGVLLTKDEQTEKVKLLFSNYDDNANGKLSREEIRLMFSDISLISFKYLTSILKFKDQSENLEILEKYQRDLMNMRPSIIGYYSNTLFEDYEMDEMCAESFIRILRNSKISSMLNPSRFRIYTLEIWSNIEKVVKATSYIMDENNKESQELFKKIDRINIRKTPRRKSTQSSF